MDETKFPLTITVEFTTKAERDRVYEEVLSGKTKFRADDKIVISKACKQRMRPDLSPHDFLHEEDT